MKSGKIGVITRRVLPKYVLLRWDAQRIPLRKSAIDYYFQKIRCNQLMCTKDAQLVVDGEKRNANHRRKALS